MNLLKTSLILYPSAPGPGYRVGYEISNRPIVPKMDINLAGILYFLSACMIGAVIWLYINP